MAEAAGPGFSETMMGATTKVAADGTWGLRDVPPGEYQLEASGTARDASEDSALMALTVTGADMEGIALIVDPGGTVSGQVLTHDGTPLPEQLSRGRVTALSTGSDRRFRSDKSGLDDGRLSADGTFALGGISGPSLLSVSPLPRPWVVRNVEVAGREHVDIPLEVRGGHRLDGAKIVVTNRFPTLNGTVTDERGEPGDAVVLLFPEDRSKWLEGAGMVRFAGADQTGHVRFEGVRPGDYLAVALDDFQRSQLYDPEFLEGLRSEATRVTLREGETSQVGLKVRKLQATAVAASTVRASEGV